jgi:hypothetical protein
MNNRRLSYGLLLTLATTLVAACGGGETPANEAPQPSAAPSAEAAPAMSATASAAPEATPAAPASAAPEAAPAPVAKPVKPAKEKFVGKFVQVFEGEVKDAFEADAKKKFAKEKDTKKHDEAMKKAQEAAAEVTVENTGDMHIMSIKGKPVHKIKYEIGTSDATTLAIKLGKDDVSKKDSKGAELTITFTDDNTFTVKDPAAKDPKTAKTLVFKRQ